MSTQLVCNSQSPGTVFDNCQLTAAEQEAVSGGFLPAAGFAVALVSHIGLLGTSGGTISMGVGAAAHLLSGFGLAYATYEFMSARGGGGIAGSKPLRGAKNE